MRRKLISSLLIAAMATMFLTGCNQTDKSNHNAAGENNAQNTGDDLVGEMDDNTSDNENANRFGEFSAQTLTGETISSDVFAEYDLTMVNLWGTFCKPCIDEMDELAELYKGLSDNLNMITICYDGDTQRELAMQILEEKGATFDTVVADDTVRSTILSSYMVFPTTVFVDRNGNIVGDLMLGGPSRDIVETYMQEINYRLDALGI